MIDSIHKLAVAVAVAAAGGLALASGASGATGDLFSFAEQTDSDPPQTSAPAFPAGPEARAWWAGVCDLTATTGPGAFAVGGVPSYSFPNCIDHPPSWRTGNQAGEPEGQLQPPLSPGLTPGTSGPDGWRREGSGALGGPDWRLADVTQAGAVVDGSASFWLSRGQDYEFFNSDANGGPDGSPRAVRVSIPPGVIGNPNAVPKCSSEDLRVTPAACPPQSQVGVSTVSFGGHTAVFPVYNAVPRDGKVAEFIISGTGLTDIYVTNFPIVAEARTDGDFGVDAFGTEIPSAVAIHSQTFTVWGVPWAKSHDRYRPVPGYCQGASPDPFGTTAWTTTGMSVQGLPGGLNAGCSQDPVTYHPSWGPIEPFFTTQTDCSPQNPVTKIRATNYSTPVVAEEDSVAPQITGCGDIQFSTKAGFSLAATSTAADGASGLEVELAADQNTLAPLSKRFNPCDVVGSGCTADDVANSAVEHWKSTAGLATSHLDQTLLELPPGLTVNPSGATGLGGCSEAQIGLTAQGNPPTFNNGDPFDGLASDGAECPQSSIIGKVHEVKTHLLDETLSGELVLGQPKADDIKRPDLPDPDRKPLRFRIYLVVRNRERGLVAKIFGTTVADPATGQLTANFDNNPRVPFDRLRLSVKGGSKGMVALPQRCGSSDWSSELVPWSGGESAIDSGSFVTNSNCGNGFGPSLAAGMSTPAARANGTFSFKFTRPQGDQYFRGLTAKLPDGLLASVKGLPLCSNALADAGACPASSKIGVVDAKAGSGDPFVLEEKGEMFLTEGYKGGEYGLAVKVRPIAGPFRGDAELSTIVVRQAVHVDRRTAKVTAISDPFPLIHHGVPLRVREVTVLVNRPAFMLNPSGCDPKQVGADLASDQGASVSRSNPFQASDCARLRFKPRLGLRLTGRRQVTTGRHPGIRAVVRQNGIPEAGIKRAEVRLPKSLALDVDNAQALCEFEDGIKDDLENHCPKGSIIGRARAVSPLLNDPLVGDVFFVKNVRIDPSTGNQIRTLPMLIVALRGEISINLRGESDVKSKQLVSTFASIPDAPVSQFNMNIKGGGNGIIAVTRTRRSMLNLCRLGDQVAEADMDGVNGRVHDFDVVMRKPCPRGAKAACKTRRQKATRTCKRRAGKAAARRAAASAQRAVSRIARALGESA